MMSERSQLEVYCARPFSGPVGVSRIKKPIPGREALAQERAVVVRCLAALEAGDRVASLGLHAEESKLIRGFRLLTEIPQMAILNVGEAEAGLKETPASFLPARD